MWSSGHRPQAVLTFCARTSNDLTTDVRIGARSESVSFGFGLELEQDRIAIILTILLII